MIDLNCRQFPVGRCVAIGAKRCGQHMGRCYSRFDWAFGKAQGFARGMAADAGASHLRMINLHRRHIPVGCGQVAIGASGSGGDVGRGPLGHGASRNRQRCIVAGCARADGGCVVEVGRCHWFPHSEAYVAGIAGVVGLHMRGVFAGGSHVVMSGEAGASFHARVVEGQGGDEGCGGVAQFAGVCGWQMRLLRTLQLTDDDKAAWSYACTVVAGEAGACHLRMINWRNRWRPFHSVMADHTVVGG